MTVEVALGYIKKLALGYMAGGIVILATIGAVLCTTSLAIARLARFAGFTLDY